MMNKTYMMKKLALLPIVFLALFSVAHATADCEIYIQEAHSKISPPYPNYFGAGEEYYNAAECYKRLEKFQEANSAYLNAARYYEKAAEYIVEGGDHLQKGGSYERAAESYLAVGEYSKAIKSYEEAKLVYSQGGYAAKAQNIETILEELQEREEYATAIELTRESIIGLISLITLFISILFLALIAAANLTKEKERSFTVPDEPKTKEEPVKTPQREATPRERVIKKLREKYAPKE